MKKISVLMLGTSLSTNGGMTTVVESFLEKQIPNVEIKFIPTHIEGNSFIKLIYFSYSLVRILGNVIFCNIDIIHLHFSERGSFYRKYLITLISRLFKKKVIIHMHGAEFKEFYSKSSNNIKFHILKMLENADHVLVLGDSWFEYVSSLSCKINVSIFRNAVKIPTKKVEFNCSNINVLFMGVLIKRKGIYDLVEAAKKIILLHENIRFIIAGSGIEENNLKEYIKNERMLDYFEFTGWVREDNKQELYEKSQVFILPSYNEGLPVAILEAMSYGLPVVTTSVGSIEDVVKHKMTGYIFKPGDIDEMVNGINYCIRNQEEWEVLSLASSELIKKAYDEKIYFENIKKMYEKLVLES